MRATYRTCKHIYDTGGTCDSAAVKDQHYCIYHLRHRARLMRMAQYRARNQRLVFRLPPLENMYAVHSALNQLTEAAGAGMIDLKEARYLLSVVRAAGQFLLHVDKWQANPYHSGQPAAAIDLVKEYGLPVNLDLDLQPEEAFPAEVSNTDNRPLTTDNRIENRQLTTDNLPFSGDYCQDHRSRECDCVRIRPDYPMTAERAELLEVQRTQGDDAAIARYKQQRRNQRRRYITTDRKRFAAVALENNMRLAAERLAQQKLAQRAKDREVGITDSGNCGYSAIPKKPAASVDSTAEVATADTKSTA